MTNFHPQNSSIPKHIGIIPDGGRRYAVKKEITLFDSYALSMIKLRECCNLFFTEGVEVISIYFSSKQNFKRTSKEIHDFETAELTFVTEQIPILKKSYNNIRVNFLGAIDMLDSDFQRIVHQHNVINESMGNDCLIINLCVAYDPFDEIKEIVENYSPQVNIFDQLWCSKPVDIIIRSGGANLLSNFMLLQSGFAKIYCDKRLFNELTLNDMSDILNRFNGENRKYGD